MMWTSSVILSKDCDCIKDGRGRGTDNKVDDGRSHLGECIKKKKKKRSSNESSNEIHDDLLHECFMSCVVYGDARYHSALCHSEHRDYVIEHPLW